MAMKTGETTVLVVDDEDDDRSNIARILAAKGYAVLEANCYSDAMAVFDLNGKAVTLLITDLALPDGNGFSLALAIKKQKPDLRALFVSFQVGMEYCKYYGLTVPNLHLLRKPFTESKLVKRIRRVFRADEPFPKLEIPKTLTSGQSF